MQIPENSVFTRSRYRQLRNEPNPDRRRSCGNSYFSITGAADDYAAGELEKGLLR